MENTYKFNKLVRDKIPEIIRAKGQWAKTEILSDTDYWAALKEKLNEEVREFQDSEDVEELADILEVVYSLSRFLGMSLKELEKIRMEKQDQRGGFKQRLFLIEAEDTKTYIDTPYDIRD